MDSVVMWLLFLGVAAAVYLATKHGTREARIRRRLRRTPLRSIASFPDGGTGRIRGRIEFIEKPLIAPLSKRPCVLHHVYVEHKRSRHNWKAIIDDEHAVDFAVVDATGRAVIRVRRAQSAITKDASYTSGPLDDATPDLETFLASHRHSSKGLFGFNKTLWYLEGVLSPKEEVTVCGPGRWGPGPNPGQRVLEMTRGGKGGGLFITDDTDTVQGTFTPLRKRRKKLGHCVICGYDLRGKYRHGCPECGWRR